MTGPSSSYSIEEVNALIEGYRVLREAVTASPRRLWLLVRLVDLDDGMDTLPSTARTALSLCGVHGFTRQEAANLIGVHVSTMERRYKAGLALLTNSLNGGPT